MNDDQNNNLNTMSLANQDEVPLSIESISDISPKQQTSSNTTSSIAENNQSSIFNQNTINSSLSTESQNQNINTSINPENINGIPTTSISPSFSLGTSQNSTEYKNLIEEQAKIIASPESAKFSSNQNGISGGVNFISSNKKILMITGGVSLLVVLLGVGGFFLFSNMNVTPPAQESISQQPETPSPLSKEEYLNEIASAEITYNDIRSGIIESLTKFREPTILELFTNVVDKNSAVADRLSVVVAPDEFKDSHQALSSYFTSLRYTLEVIGTGISNQDGTAVNDLIPVLNGTLQGIDEEFKKIKGE